MTTIAYRDGVLAGDSLITSSSIRVGTLSKIARRADGAVCGACGCASLIRATLDWFMAGEQGTRPAFGENDAQAIIVRPNGTIEMQDDKGSYPLQGPFFALGSGSEIAIGAMAAGASALEAVRHAVRWDSGRTGGRIRSVRLG